VGRAGLTIAVFGTWWCTFQSGPTCLLGRFTTYSVGEGNGIIRLHCLCSSRIWDLFCLQKHISSCENLQRRVPGSSDNHPLHVCLLSYGACLALSFHGCCFRHEIFLRVRLRRRGSRFPRNEGQPHHVGGAKFTTPTYRVPSCWDPIFGLTHTLLSRCFGYGGRLHS
jgi:hypothetical protein